MPFLPIGPDFVFAPREIPPAAFQSIPDGTHFLFLDRPERGRSAFLKLILGFLESRERQPGPDAAE